MLVFLGGALEKLSKTIFLTLARPTTLLFRDFVMKKNSLLRLLFVAPSLAANFTLVSPRSFYFKCSDFDADSESAISF